MISLQIQQQNKNNIQLKKGYRIKIEHLLTGTVSDTTFCDIIADILQEKKTIDLLQMYWIFCRKLKVEN